MTTLIGRRILLRPLLVEDFPAWRRVRRRNADWLTRWEPQRIPGSPNIVEDRAAFSLRCHAREREWHLGNGFGFGLFVDGVFSGEININSIQRGPFQNAYIGYWIDEAQAGYGYIPEGLVLVMKYAFESVALHRVQVSIVPRNAPSLRVAEKLGLRQEGVALKYLEIDGVWEDHARFAMTSEEWEARGPELGKVWL